MNFLRITILIFLAGLLIQCSEKIEDNKNLCNLDKLGKSNFDRNIKYY
jgi:hypothetical protein